MWKLLKQPQLLKVVLYNNKAILVTVSEIQIRIMATQDNPSFELKWRSHIKHFRMKKRLGYI